MTTVVAIRPEPGCSATVAAVQALGMKAAGYPLFEVGAVAWEPPSPAEFDLILAGSANVFRHGGEGLAPLRALPVYVVGETTAEAARTAGFTVAVTGSGGLQTVLDAVPSGARVLRLAGAERLALAPPPGVRMAERTVYASKPVLLPDELRLLLAKPCVVLLHSAFAAQHLRAELARLGLPMDRHRLVTIGPRVTAAAGAGWRGIATAAAPSETALLAKLCEMCQITPTERGRD